jgi:hypothetical protein
LSLDFDSRSSSTDTRVATLIRRVRGLKNSSRVKVNRVAGAILELVKRELSLKIEEAEATTSVAMKETQESFLKNDAVKLKLSKHKMWFERMFPLSN